MFQIILTVISIALIAMTTLATVNYINPSTTAQRQVQAQMTSGFETLHAAWDAYRKDHEVYGWECETYTSAEGATYEDCQKVLQDPGYLPVSGWSAALVPEYTFLPTLVGGLNWSYGSNTLGWYFCAEGGVNMVQLKGIYRSRQDFPIDQLLVSDTCGVDTGKEIEVMDPANTKVTYWLKRN